MTIAERVDLLATLDKRREPVWDTIGSIQYRLEENGDEFVLQMLEELCKHIRGAFYHTMETGVKLGEGYHT